MWFILFSDAREDPLRSPEVIWGVAGITIALLAGAAVIYAVDQWRKRTSADTSDSDASGALTSYRTMYENGELTEAEYAELRRRLAEKMKKPVPKPAAPAAPAGTMPPLPSFQPGERKTANPPAPPSQAPEPPAPPGTT